MRDLRFWSVEAMWTSLNHMGDIRTPLVATMIGATAPRTAKTRPETHRHADVIQSW